VIEMAWVKKRSQTVLQAGITGSIPVTSTNFFLIAKDLEKSPGPERSFICAHWSEPLK
jgi:hypothetical protein